MAGKLTAEKAWRVLEEVKDPEIPVVSVVEMGIVRDVQVDGAVVQVVLTPTFAGCPALQAMRLEIEQRLRQAGAQNVHVKLSLSPAWTSDWIAPEARQKLREFGLAPPALHGGRIDAALLDAVRCPYCDSSDTTLKNSFGPTLCRAIYYCNNCRQPFEQFKPL